MSTITDATTAVREAEDAAREAKRGLERAALGLRVEYKVVGHIVSASVDSGYVGRLVLEDPEGFFAAVLAVGEPKRDPVSAIDDAVRAFRAGTERLDADS